MHSTLKPTERIVSTRRLTASSLGLWAMLFLAAAAPVNLLAEARYVYHERTTADPGCGGNYVTTLNPQPLLGRKNAMLFAFPHQHFQVLT